MQKSEEESVGWRGNGGVGGWGVGWERRARARAARALSTRDGL